MANENELVREDSNKITMPEKEIRKMNIIMGAKKKV